MLASPDGERFRVVDRLPSHAADAVELFEASERPALSLEVVRRLYGPDVALRRLL